MKLISPSRLKALGILGINRRNTDFIAKYNPRHLYPMVDNKLETKKLAEKFNIPTPKLHFSLKNQYETKDMEEKLKKLQAFAIKPARGSGGKGILVISKSINKAFVKSSGKILSSKHIQRHLSNILAGLYSLGGNPDSAFVEDIIEMDPLFHDYSYQGIPDIRVIVFKGYPVMAMLRLATSASDGKANLHQGAIGIGLDLKSGKGLKALHFGRLVKHHPDTGKTLDNIAIPDWEKLLMLSARCHQMTELGYIGVDIVLDKNKGPLLLELNARPGLAIQITNGRGLLLPLLKLEKLMNEEKEDKSLEEKVAYSMEHFGEEGVFYRKN